MAEGRMLKKRISESKKLGGLQSDSARLLYTWLIPWLDVEGRYLADSDILKGHIFPKVKTITPNKIKKLLDMLNRERLIILYSVNGENYLQFTKFQELQIIRKDREGESKIPIPTKDSIITPGLLQDDSCINKDKIIKDKSIESKENVEEICVEFEEWWDFYDHKVGGKEETLDLYKTLREKTTKEEIAKVTHGYLDYLKHERIVNNFPRNKKDPKTFLRPSKWKDKVTEFVNFKYEPSL